MRLDELLSKLHEIRAVHGDDLEMTIMGLSGGFVIGHPLDEAFYDIHSFMTDSGKVHRETVVFCNRDAFEVIENSKAT